MFESDNSLIKEPKTTIEICSACKTDLPIIADIHTEAFSRQINSNEWVTCNFRAFPRIMIFVAKFNSTIVGYIQWIQKSGLRIETVMELEQIAVLLKYQRQGIGRALIIRSLHSIKKHLSSENRKLKSILVTTRVDNFAQKIYKDSLNAKVIATISDLYSNDEVIMMSNLS